jgi:hypothetical protein
LATIRAYGETQRFIADDEYFIDLENRALLLICANQVRQSLHTALAVLSLLFAEVAQHSPGLHGWFDGLYHWSSLCCRYQWHFSCSDRCRPELLNVVDSNVRDAYEVGDLGHNAYPQLIMAAESRQSAEVEVSGNSSETVQVPHRFL